MQVIKTGNGNFHGNLTRGSSFKLIIRLALVWPHLIGVMCAQSLHPLNPLTCPPTPRLRCTLQNVFYAHKYYRKGVQNILWLRYNLLPKVTPLELQLIFLSKITILLSFKIFISGRTNRKVQSEWRKPAWHAHHANIEIDPRNFFVIMHPVDRMFL